MLILFRVVRLSVCQDVPVSVVSREKVEKIV